MMWAGNEEAVKLDVVHGFQVGFTTEWNDFVSGRGVKECILT